MLISETKLGFQVGLKRAEKVKRTVAYQIKAKV